MVLRLEALTLEVADPAAATEFWAALAPHAEHQLRLRFVSGSAPSSGRELHLHLTSSDPDDQQHTIERALALGAEHRDVGQLPEEGHVVLADPQGTLFCVIEPGNRFLAGCGFLAEVACDGSREVGHFWSEALGWPLNWDQDGETSIQSPQGGTKISWGGGPEEPKAGRNRQWLDVVVDAAGGDPDRDAELERLVSLGATRLGELEDGAVELADPDGNEFRISAATPASAPPPGVPRP
jgi:hypothetical protein